MESIELIKGSDGSGNASLMTVQSIRSPGATTINVNTVSGVNQTFYASMGTPHTFTDPITNESITVISEATAVDFRGHIDAGKLEIDEIAPGYTDLGSQVGDIVVIRPITEWANNVARVLDVSHNDDGSLKADSVTTAAIEDEAVKAGKIDFTTFPIPNLIVGLSSDTSASSTKSTLNLSKTILDMSDGVMLTKSNSGIKIGTGLRAVRVSASVYFTTGAANTPCRIYIVKNSSDVTYTITTPGSNYAMAVSPSIVIPVQPNDIIRLYVGSTGTPGIRADDFSTFLAVTGIM